MFVYKIVNSINSLVYIGITSVSLEERFSWHKRDYKRNLRRKLYSAFAELGVENFQIILIEKCTEEVVKNREEFYINFYDSYHNGYNSSPKSGGVKFHTEETKILMSKKATGRKASDTTKEKISKASRNFWDNITAEQMQYISNMNSINNKGRVRSKQQKENHSKFMQGRLATEETKKKMSESRKKYMKNISETFICNICGKSGTNRAAMNRWHFGNCKETNGAGNSGN
jgi:group I intron endonuclease